MFKKQNRKLLVGMTAALLALLLFSGTLAYWVSAAPATHVINTGTLDGALVEEYTPPETLEPGVDVKKVVNVKNVGAMDMLVRIKVTKVWGDHRDSDNKLVADTTLSTDNIIIEYDDTMWMDGGDGYFYYKGILKAGETTLKPLFKSFVVDADATNTYANKMADIIVSMECLQAGGDAISAVWHTSYERLGVTAPAAAAQTPTKVLFNTDKKFVFNPVSTDLFADFKDLVPSETRVQTVEVTNQYDKTVEISVRALFVDQTLATPENINYVNALLQKYAIITIVDESGKVLYTGPVWGNYNEPSTGTDSMKDFISLGEFTKDQTKKLTVTLKLDPGLDNNYQNLIGRIRWEFQADGNTGLPDTGGSSNMALWLIVFFTAVAAGVIVFITMKKMKTTE